MENRADSLMKDIILLSKYISGYGNHLLEKYELTPPQFYVLAEVFKSGKISQQVIANELKVTEGNISHIVQNMEQKGMILRTRDGKFNNLQLTDQSRLLMEKLMVEHVKLSDSFFSKLSKSDFNELERIVQMLLGHLK